MAGIYHTPEPRRRVSRVLRNAAVALLTIAGLTLLALAALDWASYLRFVTSIGGIR